jgi:HYDIN/CFA65/VesB-like, Ig-like domain
MGLLAPSRPIGLMGRSGLTCNLLLVTFALVILSLPGCGAYTKAPGSSSGPPSISSQPASQVVVTSQTATFSVTAAGAPPLRYQWIRNETAISGATSSSYTTPVLATSDTGTRFAVVVRNAKGSVLSTAATVRVNAPGRLNTSVSSLNFGSVTIDHSVSLPLTLLISGNSDVAISTVSISGPGFNVSGLPAGSVLAPGQTNVMDVTFAPAASGNVTGSITISSNAANPPAVISLSGSGAQPILHSVSLALVPGGSNIVGYNLYRGTVSGGPYEKLTPSLNANASFTDTNVQAGQTYYYVATSVDSSNTESPYSNEVSVTVPTS